MRYGWLVIFLGTTLVRATLFGQSLFSARAVGLGAYSASVQDIRGFAVNPAGLVNMRDWDITTTTFTQTSVAGAGFIFHGFGVGKRFLENNAAAMQYSPGTVQEFVLPSQVQIGDGTKPITLGTRVKYGEQFSFGYAHRVLDNLAAGVGGRLRSSRITETRLQFAPVGDSLARLVNDTTYSADSWLFDFSVMWRPVDRLSISAVGRSLVKANSGGFGNEFERFRLANSAALEVGAAYEAAPWARFAAEASTAGNGAFGIEVVAGHDLFARSSLHVSADEPSTAYAMGFGVGWKIALFDLDAGYLMFFNKDRRKGTTSLSAFDASKITSMDLNSYSSDRLTLSLKVMVGELSESLLRIESVEILGGVYPSAYQSLAYKPLGTVRVKNTSAKGVQAKASFFVERFMDAPTETSPVYILPGEVTEIPLNAVLNDRVRKVPTLAIHEANVYVSATTGDRHDDKYQTKVLIHGKNDWDGDVLSLRYFVTPDDPAVIRYTRDVLLKAGDSLSSVARELEPFQKARVLFNTFAGKLLYVGDPKQSGDYVQYPAETLDLRGGDCDDMTVCFASLLSSIGISTAFVDVVPPDHPERSHIYMLFDTGVEPRFADKISPNPKRYVVRKNSAGVQTIWIPIESTVITKGFEEAWAVGAQEYFADTELNLGLVKGWVRIVDVY